MSKFKKVVIGIAIIFISLVILTFISIYDLGVSYKEPPLRNKIWLNLSDIEFWFLYLCVVSSIISFLSYKFLFRDKEKHPPKYIKYIGCTSIVSFLLFWSFKFLKILLEGLYDEIAFWAAVACFTISSLGFFMYYSSGLKNKFVPRLFEAIGYIFMAVLIAFFPIIVGDINNDVSGYFIFFTIPAAGFLMFFYIIKLIVGLSIKSSTENNKIE